MTLTPDAIFADDSLGWIGEIALVGDRLVALDVMGSPGEVVLGEALSDGRGAFNLPMPAPGVYRLRITRIGYESWASDTLHIATGGASRALRLHVPVQPIPLPELSVSEQNVCPTTPEERRRAFALYESVLPILATVSSTADLGTLQMRMIRPSVVWRRGAHRYQQDTATSWCESPWSTRRRSTSKGMGTPR
ncbi:carboxypeptidase-like regulatory domain-containing protein [Candidatus Palauibacter sp.]|uniref:carboxypeptidase-like regulatory domain-containing protein n=1 Tax=Candidatus Palauibacter sp. TaxID=3101350 RepID=UPI003C6FB6AE